MALGALPDLTGKRLGSPDRKPNDRVEPFGAQLEPKSLNLLISGFPLLGTTEIFCLCLLLATVINRCSNCLLSRRPLLCHDPWLLSVFGDG